MPFQCRDNLYELRKMQFTGGLLFNNNKEYHLILGKGQKSAILSFSERSKNYLIMERLPQGKNPDAVARLSQNCCGRTGRIYFQLHHI